MRRAAWNDAPIRDRIGATTALAVRSPSSPCRGTLGLADDDAARLRRARAISPPAVARDLIRRSEGARATAASVRGRAATRRGSHRAHARAGAGTHRSPRTGCEGTERSGITISRTAFGPSDDGRSGRVASYSITSSVPTPTFSAASTKNCSRSSTGARRSAPSTTRIVGICAVPPRQSSQRLHRAEQQQVRTCRGSGGSTLVLSSATVPRRSRSS